LVNGAPSRVGRLRAYGNAINVEAATLFIEASGL
jgi:DNA (cytosine-5)-methyltransferase 1